MQSFITTKYLCRMEFQSFVKIKSSKIFEFLIFAFVAKSNSSHANPWIFQFFYLTFDPNNFDNWIFVHNYVTVVMALLHLHMYGVPIV